MAQFVSWAQMAPGNVGCGGDLLFGLHPGAMLRLAAPSCAGRHVVSCIKAFSDRGLLGQGSELHKPVRRLSRRGLLGALNLHPVIHPMLLVLQPSP